MKANRLLMIGFISDTV